MGLVACLIEHFFHIAVVCGNQNLTLLFSNCLQNLLEAGIYGFNRFYRGLCKSG